MVDRRKVIAGAAGAIGVAALGNKAGKDAKKSGKIDSNGKPMGKK